MNTTVEFTPVMLILIAFIAAVLQGFKAMVWAEKVKQIFPLVAAAIGIGACFASQQENPVVSGIVVGMAASFGFDIFKGIGPKNGAKIVLCLLLLNIAGCVPNNRPVQMDPMIQAQVELATTTTKEFNRRCQGGDANACKTGLELSCETLEIIVDGLHGEVTP